jgi:hypothetical protein
MITAAGGNAAATPVDATDRDALADVARFATAELGKAMSHVASPMHLVSPLRGQ